MSGAFKPSALSREFPNILDKQYVRAGLLGVCWCWSPQARWNAGAIMSSVKEGNARKQWQKLDPNPISNPISISIPIPNPNPNLNPKPNPNPIAKLILNPNPNPKLVSNSISNLIPNPSFLKKSKVLILIPTQDSRNPNSKKISAPEFDSCSR